MKKPLRSVLVDDEEFCRRDLAELLQKNPAVQVVGEAATPREAIQLINQTKPDVVFLDLNLANLDGFKILGGIEKMPAVIAVTAFPQHAHRGYHFNLADYILKPVEEERLNTALHRARDQILLRSLKENAEIHLEIGGRTSRVALTDLYWVKSSENYVEVCTTQGKGLIRSTLTNFQKKLPAGYSLEIARGLLMARHQIKSWSRDSKGHLIITLKCGATFPVSKRQQKEVLELLELSV